MEKDINEFVCDRRRKNKSDKRLNKILERVRKKHV